MPDFSKIWATNSPLPAYTFTDAEYLEGWDFVDAAPPTKNQFDAWFKQTDEKLKWLYDKLNDTANAIYPVGAVYISFVSTSPASLFGGTWTRLKDTFLLANGDSYAANTTGGSATKTITVNNLPAHNHSVNSAGAHTHTATTASSGSHSHSASTASSGAHTHEKGSMNITGVVCGVNAGGAEGAFSRDSVRGGYINVGMTAHNDIAYWKFNAASSWTGATASNGAHTHTVTVNSNGAHTHTTNNTGGSQPINIMPPYTTVYMWRRTA
jgi:microcystin-dependent protein